MIKIIRFGLSSIIIASLIPSSVLYLQRLVIGFFLIIIT